MSQVVANTLYESCDGLLAFHCNYKLAWHAVISYHLSHVYYRLYKLQLLWGYLAATCTKRPYTRYLGLCHCAPV